MEISIRDNNVFEKRITLEIHEDEIIISALFDDEVEICCELNLNDFKNAFKFLEENGRK